MTENEKLAFALLKSLDIAVLSRTGPRNYELLGEAPPFYQSYFPFAPSGGPCLAPWEHSPMLEFFLDDAEAFFEKGQEGQISSGVWQEDGKTNTNSALLANAYILGNARILTIRVLCEDYRQRAGILRKARQQLLDNRRLASSLEMFKIKSRYDDLTGVFNRATFMESLQGKMKVIREKAEAGKSIIDPPSILMIDIDDFKKINDSYGHMCGDIVLKGLGALFLDTLRKSDVVARYGGEEFIVLITRGTAQQARGIAEKVRQAVERHDFSGAPRITISTGCATYIPGEDPEQLISRADIALYDAKRSGKNKVCFR